MDIQKYLIPDDMQIAEAIKRIDEGRKKIVFCVRGNRLVGAFTDGDMRRFILRDGDMGKPVRLAMNAAPISLSILQESSARAFVEKNAMVALPLVDEHMEVVKICFRDEQESRRVTSSALADIPLVIMAGGKGTRLYPYTRILPKPLIPIGDMPIMDHIMHRFGQYGIRDVYMILNHKRNMIKAYYSDADMPFNIHYIDEEQFLGTGGGLSLLKGKIHSTFFLSNCDCLLDADYTCMYDYHREHQNVITFILAAKGMSIPYGVVELTQSGAIQALKEKPEFSFLVNTGIYLLEPQVLDTLQDGEAIGFPDIAQRLMDSGHNVGGYPITEKSWMDMGQLNEIQNMSRELGFAEKPALDE